MSACWLAQFADTPCDGRPVKAHLIPRQLLAREFPDGFTVEDELGEYTVPLDALIENPSTWVWACGGPMGNGGHHGMLDSRSGHANVLRVPRAMLPRRVEWFAADVGLDWWLDREYGPR
jgi:hypothetical protein